MNIYISILITTLALLILVSNTTYFATLLNFKLIGLASVLIAVSIFLLSKLSGRIKVLLPGQLSETFELVERYLVKKQHHMVLYSLLIVMFLYIKTIPSLNLFLPIQIITLLLGIIGALLFKPNYRVMVGISIFFLSVSLLIYLSGYPLWADRACVYGYGFLLIALFQMVRNKDYK